MNLEKAREMRTELLKAGWLNQPLQSSAATTIVRILILPKDDNTRSMYESKVTRNGWPEFDYDETELFYNNHPYSVYNPADRLTLYVVLKKHDLVTGADEFKKDLLINLVHCEGFFLPESVKRDQILL
jgi:hypothetical protein